MDDLLVVAARPRNSFRIVRPARDCSVGYVDSALELRVEVQTDDQVVTAQRREVTMWQQDEGLGIIPIYQSPGFGTCVNKSLYSINLVAK